MSEEKKPAQAKKVSRKRAPDVEYRFHDPAAGGTDTAFVRLKKAGWTASNSHTPGKSRVILLKRPKNKPADR
jgi:hypothetical protein